MDLLDVNETNIRFLFLSLCFVVAVGFFFGFFSVCVCEGGGVHYNFINVRVKNPEKGTIRFNDKYYSIML